MVDALNLSDLSIAEKEPSNLHFFQVNKKQYTCEKIGEFALSLRSQTLTACTTDVDFNRHISLTKGGPNTAVHFWKPR